jgi:hypothetical protein
MPVVATTRGKAKGPAPLSLGSRGAEVIRLQSLLNARLSPSPSLPLSGIFDTTVQTAVRNYQQGVRIAVDGRVGKETWYRLMKGDTATVMPAVAPAAASATPPAIATPTVQVKPAISSWTLEQKFKRVLELTPPKLPGHMRAEFMALLDPTALAIIVGTLAVWAASHAIGVGEVVDVLLLIGGVIFLGMSAIDAAGHIYDFLTLTVTADEEKDLDAAAGMLAKAVAILGVAAFAALIAKGAKRLKVGKKAPPPDQKPLAKDPGKKIAAADPNPPSQKVLDDVLKTDKGQRPAPSSYLDKTYVDNHLNKFDSGGSYITKKSTLDNYGRDKVGWPDNSQFVMPKDQMDDVLKTANGDMSVVEKELGIPKGAWQQEEMVRIDIPDPKQAGLRMPSGNEMGANKEWLPGGKLPTGYDEAVTNQLPKGTYVEGPLWK